MYGWSVLLKMGKRRKEQEMEQSRNKFFSKLEKYAFVMLCVLMLDCSIFGAGKIVKIGGISFRQFVLAILLILSVPTILKKIGFLLKDPIVWMVIAFGGWVIISAIMGMKNKHRMDLLLSDVKGFIYFVFLPTAMCLLSSKERILALMRTMMYGAMILGVLAILYLVAYIVTDIGSIIDWGHDQMFTRISGISDKIPRIFFHSELYLLCGCAFACYLQMQERKLSLKYIVVIAIDLWAVLLSYTRSVYLATLLAAVGTLLSIYCFVDSKQRKILYKFVGGAIILTLILMLGFSAIFKTNYAGYAFSRTVISTEQLESTVVEESSSIESEKEQQDAFNEQTILSDQLRAITKRDLLTNIKKSPWIGLGLGAEIPSRPSGYNEYFYLDLWSKSGIIGVVLYILPILWMVVRFVREKNRDNKSLVGVFLSVLIGFAVYSYFNPYMNASLGILFYCCVIGVSKFTTTNKINQIY